MVSRGPTRCEFTAALARASNCGLMAGGVVTIGCAGAAGSGASGSTPVLLREKLLGKICELADDDRTSPAAPKAPKRNISRRFNDTRTLPNEAHGLTFNRLMADNPNVQVALSVPRWSRFAARSSFFQQVGGMFLRVEGWGRPC